MGRLRVGPCAIGFSGRISSGKTTVSLAVAQKLQCPCASFGNYVRSVAHSRGLVSESRETLQEVGEFLISNGWPEFCGNVLAAVNWHQRETIVVDGIRHIEAVKHLSDIVAPLPFVLIHVSIDEEVRKARHFSRDGTTLETSIDSHSTEVAVKNTLPQLADLTVDASSALDVIVSEIIAYLQDRVEC